MNTSMHEPTRIGDCPDRSDADRGHGKDVRPQLREHGFLEDELLREEPGQRRDPRHRPGEDRSRDKENRRRPTKSAELQKRAGGRSALDSSDGEEEPRLEDRVGEEMEHRGPYGDVGPETDRQREEAELRDGRPCHEELDVGLPERTEAPPHAGHGAKGNECRRPEWGVTEGGIEVQQEDDARFHHRGRVQVCRHWRRRRHRSGKPRMKGNLRALGQDAHENQREGQRLGVRRQRDVAERGEADRTRGLGEHENARQHRQGARRRDDEGSPGGVERVRILAVLADEKERGDPRELPEHEEKQEIVGEHEP